MGKSANRCARKCAVLATATLMPVLAAVGAIPHEPSGGVDSLVVRRSRQTGLATFVTAADSGPILKPGAAKAQILDPAEFLAAHGHLFGVADPTTQLRHRDVRTDHLGYEHTTYDQMHNGVPIFSGELKVHRNQSGQVYAANGDFYPGVEKINTTPRLTAESAVTIARDRIAADTPVVEHSELVIVDPGWYGDPPRGPHLAYYIILTDFTVPVREAFFVDAHTDEILDQWNLVETSLYREVFDDSLGWTVRFEGDPPTGDPDSDAAYDYTGDLYGYMNRAFGRDSYDDAGSTMDVTVHLQSDSCPNAFGGGGWSYFCTGTAVDDITAHEWGHSVTRWTADLMYKNQPGQLNESYSDIWGEVVDLLNGNATFPGPPTDPANGPPFWPTPAGYVGPGTDTPNDLRLTGECAVGVALDVNAPPGIAGTYLAAPASFGPVLDATGVTGDVSLAEPADACSAITNPGAITGKVALVDRGACYFSTKVKNCQDAGAIAVIVANNIPGPPSNMSAGSPDVITIPSVMVTQTDGATIRSTAGSDTVNTTMRGIGSGGVRWLASEDSTAFGGAIRDMWEPTCLGDPDRANHPFQVCNPNDNGGVHSGSGIPNHAFAIMSDGKSFNGYTVGGIGIIKAGAVWYGALTNYLTNISDFRDAYWAVNQAAADLVASGIPVKDPRDGSDYGLFTAADALEVDKALLATEMNTVGLCGATADVLNPDPPDRCPGSTTIYSDDFESGVGDWTVSNTGPLGPPTPYDWILDSGGLPFGRTGTVWYCEDPFFGNCDTDGESALHSLFSPVIGPLPGYLPSPTLAFTHYVQTELWWDGGNVRISVDAGPWQFIPGSAFQYNPYNETIAPSSTNPLAGERAWSGESMLGGGWGTSLVDLSGYLSGGETVQFRFDFGKDACGGDLGWFVDDFELYTCASTAEACCYESAPTVCTELAPDACLDDLGTPAGAGTTCDGDCDTDGVADTCELALGTDADCNEDGTPDGCEITADPTLDENEDGILDECQIRYVDVTRAGGVVAGAISDGTTWETGYVYLQDALIAAAASGGEITEIWVAEGVYHPDDQSCVLHEDCAMAPGACIDGQCVWSPQTIASRETSFYLATGVTVYGGFPGASSMPTPEDRDELSDRDPGTYETILSGDLGDDDVPEEFPDGPSHNDNTYHVVTADGPGGSGGLDGVTVTAGNADADSGPHGNGGGVLILAANPTLANCKIEGNYAYDMGGGLYVDSAALPVTLTNCRILGNHADTRGGGGLGALNGEVDVSGVVFRGNTATVGAAMRLGIGASMRLNGCTVIGNTADTGGVFNEGLLTAVSCAFEGNVADLGGGILNRGYAELIGCSFVGNRAHDSGGAVLSQLFGEPVNPLGLEAVNCMFAGNESGQGGAVAVTDSSDVGLAPINTLTNCVFVGNRALMYDELTGNLIGGWGGGLVIGVSAEPARPSVVSNCSFTDNLAGALGGGVYSAAAVTVENSILWGNLDANGTNTGETAQISGTGGTVTVSYSLIQGLDLYAGDGNIDGDPLFGNTVVGDLRLSTGSPAIDAGNTPAVPDDWADLDDDGITAERTPIDRQGAPRVMDDFDTPDTGVPGSPVVEMGAFEYFPEDCNSNGLPPECDIDCAALDGACQVPRCGRSDDVNTDGVPDDCGTFTSECTTQGEEDYWTCCENWDLPVTWCYPDDDDNAAGVHATLGLPTGAPPLANVFVDDTVVIPAMTLNRGSTVRVTQAPGLGDLIFSGKARWELGGQVWVDFDRVIDMVSRTNFDPISGSTVDPYDPNPFFGVGPWALADLTDPEPWLLVAPEAVYGPNPLGADPSISASLIGHKVVILGGDILTDQMGGIVELTGAMSLTTRGDLVMVGGYLPGLASRADGDEDVGRALPDGRDIGTKGQRDDGLVTNAAVLHPSSFILHPSARGGVSPPPKLRNKPDPTLMTAVAAASGPGPWIDVKGSFRLVGDCEVINESLFMLEGDFVNESAWPDGFDFGLGTLQLTGAGVEQSFEVGGVDIASAEGYEKNFSLGVMHLASVVTRGGTPRGAVVRLINDTYNTVGAGDCEEVLHVRQLILDGDSRLIVDNVKLYFAELSKDPAATIETIGCGEVTQVSFAPDPPQAPEPDPWGSHVDKNRYISMVIPSTAVASGGDETAIRVTLTSLHHPDDPEIVPDFSDWEGRRRWVNSLNETHTCPDSPNFPGTTFRCAVLGCDPEYRAWGKELGGEVLHVTGAAVVPSSTYHAAQFAASCAGNEISCAATSDELPIDTGKFGDVDPLTDGLAVLDIARVVDHVKGKPYPTTWPPESGTTLFKPRVHLRPNVPDALGENAGVLDIATAVDAVKGNAYWHFGEFGPCTDACPGEAACP